jgi:DNA-binding transcriptional ArsR family regulator
MRQAFPSEIGCVTRAHSANAFTAYGSRRIMAAMDIGAGERSVRNYLNELEEAGYLEVTQRGLGKTNLYRLFLVVTKKPGNKAQK